MTPLFPSPGRHVRHLRLRAPSPATARHAAIVLEDALRVSTLPAADEGRLVLIRRLDLGRIPAGASSPSLALRISQRCRELPAVTVETASSSAYSNPATVVFADRADAIRSLARRWARRAPTADWFWPLAVPGWRPNLSSSSAWRVLFQAALAEPSAPIVAAELVGTAVAAGCLAELAASLTANDAPALYAACRWHPPPEPAVETAPSTRTPNDREPMSPTFWHSSSPFVAALARSAPVLSQCPHPVSAWLAAALAVGIQPALNAVSNLPTFVARRLSDLRSGPTPPPQPTSAPRPIPNPTLDIPSAQPPPQLSPTAPSPATARDPETAQQRNPPPNPLEIHPAPHPPTPSPKAQASEASLVEPAPSISEERADPIRAPSHALGYGEITAGGGLMFAVPILARLDFADWLTARPELLAGGFGAGLLLHLGRRVGLPLDDPLLDVLQDLHGHHTSTQSTQSNNPPASPDLPWIDAIRRYSRREARLGLFTLIRRPARVRSSRTHIELHFTLAQTDLRIRRAGLDLDPGWVPWLGRIVRFHYDRSEQVAAP